MCNGLSARNTVNTCNSNDCENYYSDRHSVLHPDQPMAWTEDEQWFESWGKVYDPVPLPGQSVGNMNSCVVNFVTTATQPAFFVVTKELELLE